MKSRVKIGNSESVEVKGKSIVSIESCAGVPILEELKTDYMACLTWKQTRLSFNENNREKLQLIHTGLCGPQPTLTFTS